jgi:hypothetical protein
MQENTYQLILIDANFVCCVQDDRETEDERQQSATKCNKGRGHYDRTNSARRLSFPLQQQIALDEEILDQIMLCKCSCGKSCMGRFNRNFITECRELRYQYNSQQESNSLFLFPRIKQAYGKDINASEPSWVFCVEEERDVCLQALMWAYDAKHTTTHDMIKAVQVGCQQWGEYKNWSEDGPQAASHSQAHGPQLFHNPQSTVMQECHAYISIWLRDCTSGDSCPTAGEQIEIDPIDHLEIYKEYVGDMQARGVGHLKSYPKFNTVLNQCLQEGNIRIASRKKVSSDCPECIWIKSELIHTKGWAARRELKLRRQTHRVFNAEAQRQVVMNNEEACRCADKMGVVTFDIMDQAKLYCPAMPDSMGEGSTYKMKSKLTVFVHFGSLIGRPCPM